MEYFPQCDCCLELCPRNMKQMVKVMQGNAIYMQTYINKWTCSCHADAWGHTERCMKRKRAREEHREGERKRERESYLHCSDRNKTSQAITQFSSQVCTIQNSVMNNKELMVIYFLWDFNQCEEEAREKWSHTFLVWLSHCIERLATLVRTGLPH